MTRDQTYHKAMSDKAALEEIQRNAGTQFDPDLVEVFVRVYAQIQTKKAALRNKKAAAAPSG